MSEEQIRSYIIDKDSYDKNILVEAGAGAGKTRLIIQRVIGQIGAGIPVEKIVLITFTNAAANELYERIQAGITEIIAKCSGEEKKLYENAVMNLQRMKISTIHSFCLSMLSEQPFEADLHLGLKLAEDGETKQAQADFFERYYRTNGANIEDFGFLNSNQYKLRDSRVKNFLMETFLECAEYRDVEFVRDKSYDSVTFDTINKLAYKEMCNYRDSLVRAFYNGALGGKYEDIAGFLVDDEQFPQSLTVDLEEVCTLSGIQQIFKDHDSWKFKIEGSNDELHWAVLVDNTDGISGFDFKTPVSGEFRYIRLTILGSAKGYWAHSCEFRVFGTEKDVVSLGGRELEDLAFNALAATSSFCDNNHTQKKAFDGDNTTFWYADNNAYPHWLCADLGLPCDVRNIKQTFVEKDVWSFIIEGSNDNKKWDLLADCRSGIAGTEYVKELNGVYRYIKLTILDAKSKSRAGSRSLVIKGFGSPRNATWWEETSGMTRYYPKYYRQTLNSIKDSLDILQAQGYRNIELSAIYEGDPSVWGGLGATNNYAIDPSIGTLEDFEDLLREVHARDMRLTFFGNVGYCWYKAPFFEKACDDQRNGVYSKERNWFHFSDKKLNDNWFWSDRAQAYYYSCWGNSDGAEGRIPSYNFNNWEWQEECRNYLDFWADKGGDGILLDAPEVYDGITDDIINESIIKVLNRRGILTNAEGASNIEKWISRFDFKLIQGFDMYGWGGGKRSEVLNARRNQNPCELNGKLKSYRDRIVALGATTITPPMWEIPATNEERLFELAYLISMGTVVINHYGDHHSDYIAQLILDKWPQKDQKKFYDLIRLQNGYNGLAPMGQRTCIPSNDDSKYTVFKRSNKDGKVSALVIMNFQNSTETISVNLKNTGILLGQTPLNLLDGDNIPPVLSEDYHITLPPYGYMILGIQNEE